MLRAPLPDLDRDAGVSLAAQIAAHYAEAIRGGQMRPGDRLPPIRDVARACDVTRTTVQQAYRELATRGLVEGTVGRGTSVVGQGKHATRRGGKAKAASTETPGAASRTLSSYAEAALRRSQEMPGPPRLDEGRELVANFAELAPDGERFPVDEWRAAMDAVLKERGSELLGYGNATNGLPELRTMLAERMRDIDPRATADDVLVTAGAQQALDLVLRTFCAPGDAVIVTSPSYHQMHGLLRAHGLQVLQVPFGADGLDGEKLANALRRDNVRLLYLMPTFHNPTGRSLDLAQRRALVETVRDTSVPIVEDEYQHSLRFRGKALPTLRSLDPRGLTVTVATVSKELFPALRIGWLHAAPDLLRPMAAVKRFMDLETSPLLQAALVEFVRRGGLDRHLDALRDELHRRHDALQRAVREHLPEECTVTAPDGGFVAWLELPGAGQGDRLAELARERGVRVVPGRVFDLNARPSRGVRLSLTRADHRRIDAGLRILGQCAREIVRAPAPAIPFV
ncbi:MAG: PLP-dependent aminotransferase family protein [Planctomycetes bacterium]|nr:PLP-dependent aminotransferase family protein [Planctomycetota bacterium]